MTPQNTALLAYISVLLLGALALVPPICKNVIEHYFAAKLRFLEKMSRITEQPLTNTKIH